MAPPTLIHPECLLQRSNHDIKDRKTETGWEGLLVLSNSPAEEVEMTKKVPDDNSRFV